MLSVKKKTRIKSPFVPIFSIVLLTFVLAPFYIGIDERKLTAGTRLPPLLLINIWVTKRFMYHDKIPIGVVCVFVHLFGTRLLLTYCDSTHSNFRGSNHTSSRCFCCCCCCDSPPSPPISCLLLRVLLPKSSCWNCYVFYRFSFVFVCFFCTTNNAVTSLFTQYEKSM